MSYGHVYQFVVKPCFQFNPSTLSSSCDRVEPNSPIPNCSDRDSQADEDFDFPLNMEEGPKLALIGSGSSFSGLAEGGM